jgi:hypothetical protein
MNQPCFRTDTQADEKQNLEEETGHYVSGGSESLQVDIDRNTNHVDAGKGRGKGEKRKLGDITMHEEEHGEEAAAGSGGAAAAEIEQLHPEIQTLITSINNLKTDIETQTSKIRTQAENIEKLEKQNKENKTATGSSEQNVKPALYSSDRTHNSQSLWQDLVFRRALFLAEKKQLAAEKNQLAADTNLLAEKEKQLTNAKQTRKLTPQSLHVCRLMCGRRYPHATLSTDRALTLNKSERGGDQNAGEFPHLCA